MTATLLTPAAAARRPVALPGIVAGVGAVAATTAVAAVARAVGISLADGNVATYLLAAAIVILTLATRLR
jgi:hypothetical protein